MASSAGARGVDGVGSGEVADAWENKSLRSGDDGGIGSHLASAPRCSNAFLTELMLPAP